MPDWVSIKTEYINTQIGMRGLAAKYGVSKNTIAKRAREENWVTERDRQRDRVGTLVVQKTAEAVSVLQADRITQLLSASQKAAAMLNVRLDQMAEEGKIKTYEIKAITEALKNVRDLYETEEAKQEDKIDDGFMNALSATASQVCTGTDDSGLLPEDGDNGEEESS